ncbi:hypothetical protein R1N_18360 [Enterobacter asburiae]|nr:hypothetical protein R1N_18360 [Enterobacter asburiae]
MRKWPLIKSKACAHDDDDPGSEKLAVSRERAAPWKATLPGGPMSDNKNYLKNIELTQIEKPPALPMAFHFNA